MSLSSDSLPGSRILVDNPSRDSLALAELLRARRAEVHVAAPEPIAPELEEPVRRAESSGVVLHRNAGPGAPELEYDVLVVDLERRYPPPAAPHIARARAAGRLVSSLSDVVLALTEARTAAVTGSAGKSTTTMLLGSILDTAGETVHLPRDVPNWNPYPNYELVEKLPEMRRSDWLVAELTNEHLEYVHRSPHVAVLTVLSADHISWHGSFDAYVEAKLTVVDHQRAEDWAILNRDDELIASRVAPRVRGRCAFFSERGPVDRGVYCRGGTLVAAWDGREEPLARLDELRVPARYLVNTLAASTAALAAGASPEAIGRAVREFGGLKHRLELIAEGGGVRVFNDGFASTPRKAQAGLEIFADRSLIVLCGGHETQGFERLHAADEERVLLEAACRVVARKAAAVVVFGEAAAALRGLLAGAGLDPSMLVEEATVEGGARRAVALAARGVAATVLLSPLFWLSPGERDAFDQVAVEAVTSLTVSA